MKKSLLNSREKLIFFFNRSGGIHQAIKKQILLLMKCSTIAIMILVCIGSLAIAETSYGQKFLNNTVTITFKDASLRAALDELAAESGIKLAYTDGLVSPAARVSHRFVN